MQLSSVDTTICIYVVYRLQSCTLLHAFSISEENVDLFASICVQSHLGLGTFSRAFCRDPVENCSLLVTNHHSGCKHCNTL